MFVNSVRIVRIALIGRVSILRSPVVSQSREMFGQRNSDSRYREIANRPWGGRFSWGNQPATPSSPSPPERPLFLYCALLRICAVSL